MSAETVRFSPSTEKFFSPAYVNEVLYPPLPEQNAAHQNPLAYTGILSEGSEDPRVVDFNVPTSVKSRHKIKTPSRLYFQQLNRLLRDAEFVE